MRTLAVTTQSDQPAVGTAKTIQDIANDPSHWTRDVFVSPGDTIPGGVGAGRMFVHAADVDARYVKAHPAHAVIGRDGRGYREVLDRTGPKSLASLGDLSADCSAIVQAACDLGGAWFVPASADGLLLTRTITIGKPVAFVGECCNPYETIEETSTNRRGIGSWFHLAHADIGFLIQPPSLNSGPTTSLARVVFTTCGTYRDQPVPKAGAPFTPGDFAYDISCLATDLELRNFICLNPSRFLDFKGRRGGNLRIANLRGQPLRQGIKIDECYDVVEIDFDFWCYWSLHDSVTTWMRNNANSLYTGRVDGLHLGNVFSIFTRHGWIIDDTGSGSLNLCTISLLYIDITIDGILITDRVGTASKSSAVINASNVQVFGYPDPTIPGSALINNGTDVYLSIAHLVSAATGGAAIRQERGQRNYIALGATLMNNWGVQSADDGSGQAAIVNDGATNMIHLASDIIWRGRRPHFKNTGSIRKVVSTDIVAGD